MTYCKKKMNIFFSIDLVSSYSMSIRIWDYYVAFADHMRDVCGVSIVALYNNVLYFIFFFKTFILLDIFFMFFFFFFPSVPRSKCPSITPLYYEKKFNFFSMRDLGDALVIMIYPFIIYLFFNFFCTSGCCFIF